jgi:hypothetical protein
MLCAFDRIRTNFICISISNSTCPWRICSPRALESPRAPFFWNSTSPEAKTLDVVPLDLLNFYF